MKCNEMEAVLPRVRVEPTKLDGVLKITPPTVFDDFRGSFTETYNRDLYRAAGITQEFIQDDVSVSTRHVLRGIHGDGETWKLMSCVLGKVYFVVVDNDPESPQYRQWEALTLSDSQREQILVPPRFGNGHLVLSEQAVFHYKQTTVYNRAGQFTISWNDPAWNIWWPIKDPIVSRRDQGLGS